MFEKNSPTNQGSNYVFELDGQINEICIIPVKSHSSLKHSTYSQYFRGLIKIDIQPLIVTILITQSQKEHKPFQGKRHL